MKAIFTTNSPNWLFKKNLNNNDCTGKTLKVGEWNWSGAKEGIGAVSWHDSSICNFLVYGFPVDIALPHKKRKRGEIEGMDCQIPYVIAEYRKYYHAVDVFDKLCQNWRLQNKAQKWTTAVWWSSLKFIVVNSWILFQKITKIKMTQKEFIRKIYKKLTSKKEKLIN